LSFHELVVVVKHRLAACAGFRRSAQCGGRCGPGDPGSRRPGSGRRTFLDTAPLDRRVAEVRVVDPHHPLYGGCFPVSDRYSGRGPSLIVIRLPDGRERAISRAATAFSPVSDDLMAAASRLAHISVRTLLPLANHVRAVLASRNADLEGGDGRNLDRMPVGRDGSTRAAASPVAAAAGRDATSAGAAGGTTRATFAAAERPVRGEPSC
jgi:hypothetical protein